jgi:hypothetical protein
VAIDYFYPEEKIFNSAVYLGCQFEKLELAKQEGNCQMVFSRRDRSLSVSEPLLVVSPD